MTAEHLCITSPPPTSTQADRYRRHRPRILPYLAGAAALRIHGFALLRGDWTDSDFTLAREMFYNAGFLRSEATRLAQRLGLLR